MKNREIEMATALIQRASMNSWTTEIQSTLRTERGTAYLAHECRNEKVNEQVFPVTGHQVFFIKGWEGNWFLKFGTETLRAWPFRYGRARLRMVDHVESEVVTENVSIEDIGPLDAPHVAIRQLFMTIRTDNAEIFCPVRYLNYGTDYVQPLSGYVLWHDGEHYRIGYLGVHWNGKPTIKLALNEVTTSLRMHNLGKSALLTKITPSFLHTEAFIGIHGLKGDVTFHHLRNGQRQ